MFVSVQQINKQITDVLAVVFSKYYQLDFVVWGLGHSASRYFKEFLGWPK